MLQNKNTHQNGNAFIIILAGIFLFAALMFTFSKSGQKGSGNLTKNQAKIAAQEILNYAKLVEGAVDRVRRNGCSENEISFENDVVSGYENTSAPTDKSCHVFEPEGGKLTWVDAPTNYTNSNRTYEFSAQNAIYDLGATSGAPHCPSRSDKSRCADLTISLSNVSEILCAEINNLLFDDRTIPVGSGYPFFSGKFVGVYNGTHAGGNDAVSSECNKRPASGVQANYFYNVLLAR